MRPGLGDDVYRQLADEVRTLPWNRHAVILAARHGLPVSTVNRRVREARRRGFLEPFQARPCRLCGRPLDAAVVARAADLTDAELLREVARRLKGSR